MLLQLLQTWLGIKKSAAEGKGEGGSAGGAEYIDRTCGRYCAQDGEDRTWVRTSGGFIDAVEEERVQSYQPSSGGQASHLRCRFQLYRLSILQRLRYCRRQSSTSPLFFSPNEHIFHLLLCWLLAWNLGFLFYLLSCFFIFYFYFGYHLREDYVYITSLRSALGLFGYWRM